MFRLGLPVALLAAAGALGADEPPVRVTTDTVAYCHALAARLAALPAAAAEPALSLAEQGRRLCDSGHPRTGIAKLRRALRAAHGER